MNAADTAYGTAQAEQDKWINSIQGHLQKLSASWQSLSSTVINGDFVKGLLEAATRLVDALDAITGKAGVIPTIASAVAGAMSAFQNVGRNKMSFLLNADSYVRSVRYDSFLITFNAIHWSKRSLNMRGNGYTVTTLLP